MVDRINWLGNIRTMPPLNVVQNAFGTLISNTDPTRPPRLLKTTTTASVPTYPDIDSGCLLFPAKLQHDAAFDDTTCTDTLTATNGDEIRVFNLAGFYIPSGTYLVGWPISGTTSSGFPHYVVYSKAPDVFLGKVLVDLPPAGSGIGVVELYDSNGTDTGLSVDVVNLATYPFKSGVETPIFFDSFAKQFYPANFQDVFYGTVSNTSINSGATGDIIVVDSQNNVIGTWTGIRAACGLVRAQVVQLTFDYGQNEWVAIPINNPSIGVASANITLGHSGSVDIKTSKNNDPASLATPSTAYASFGNINTGDVGLTWWDFYEQQRYFFNGFSNVAWGEYLLDNSAGYLPLTSTGVFQLTGPDLGPLVVRSVLNPSTYFTATNGGLFFVIARIRVNPQWSQTFSTTLVDDFTCQLFFQKNLSGATGEINSRVGFRNLNTYSLSGSGSGPYSLHTALSTQERFQETVTMFAFMQLAPGDNVSIKCQISGTTADGNAPGIGIDGLSYVGAWRIG